MTSLPKVPVLGLHLSVGSFEEHVALIAYWATEHYSTYVCCVNVHMCMEVHGDLSFAKVIQEADLATADGMPMLNSLNRFNGLDQGRVAGNDLLPAVLAEAERLGLKVYFYGGEKETLDLIRARAAIDHPALKIVGTWAPPFRTLSPEEMNADAERIALSGASIVFVSLGCPRQERWMAAMRGKVNGVMLGVGGAFLLYSGTDKRAPKWMRDASLEWLFRLSLEPGRLWKRYLVTNTSFLLLYFKERWCRSLRMAGRT